MRVSTTLPDTPPEWMTLAVLIHWVARWYGVNVEIVALEIIDAVWAGDLKWRHRIAGIERTRQGLPPGLTEIDVSDSDLAFMDFGFMSTTEKRWNNEIIGKRIVADDWNKADVDRKTGTVGGWPQKGGGRKRLFIEVSWEAVKAWAEPRIKRWERAGAPPASPAKSVARQPKTKAPPPPPPPPPRASPELQKVVHALRQEMKSTGIGSEPRKILQKRVGERIKRPVSLRTLARAIAELKKHSQ